MSASHDIYLEIGKKKAIAAAVAWPGWCRSGRDEAAARQALLDYAPRYAAVVQAAALSFDAPAGADALAVVERIEGNSTTDFGAPDLTIPGDGEPGEAIGEAERDRFAVVLRACWQAFDAAVEAAQGKELRKGPRGGGRELDAMINHVIDADLAYLGRVGLQLDLPDGVEGADRLAAVRDGLLGALDQAAAGQLPVEGPRGGKRWPVRFFVRRVAWHALDHAWEIEDRIVEP